MGGGCTNNKSHRQKENRPITQSKILFTEYCQTEPQQIQCSKYKDDYKLQAQDIKSIQANQYSLISVIYNQSQQKSNIMQVEQKIKRCKKQTLYNNQLQQNIGQQDKLCIDLENELDLESEFLSNTMLKYDQDIYQRQYVSQITIYQSIIIIQFIDCLKDNDHYKIKEYLKIQKDSIDNYIYEKSILILLQRCQLTENISKFTFDDRNLRILYYSGQCTLKELIDIKQQQDIAWKESDIYFVAYELLSICLKLYRNNIYYSDWNAKNICISLSYNVNNSQTIGKDKQNNNSSLLISFIKQTSSILLNDFSAATVDFKKVIQVTPFYSSFQLHKNKNKQILQSQNQFYEFASQEERLAFEIYQIGRIMQQIMVNNILTNKQQNDNQKIQYQTLLSQSNIQESITKLKEKNYTDTLLSLLDLLLNSVNNNSTQLNELPNKIEQIIIQIQNKGSFDTYANDFDQNNAQILQQIQDNLKENMNNLNQDIKYQQNLLKECQKKEINYIGFRSIVVSLSLIEVKQNSLLTMSRYNQNTNQTNIGQQKVSNHPKRQLIQYQMILENNEINEDQKYKLSLIIAGLHFLQKSDILNNIAAEWIEQEQIYKYTQICKQDMKVSILEYLGQIFYKLQIYDNAIELYQQAITVLNSLLSSIATTTVLSENTSPINNQVVTSPNDVNQQFFSSKIYKQSSISICNPMNSKLNQQKILARLYYRLAEAQSILPGSQQKDSYQNFKKAIQLHKQVYGKNNYLLIQIYSDYSKILSEQDQYQKAYIKVQKALSIITLIQNSNDNEQQLGYYNLQKHQFNQVVINVNKRLGDIYFRQGQYQNAEKQYLLSIQIVQELFGEFSQQEVQILQNLGKLYQCLSQNNKAFNSLQKAIQLLRYSSSDDNDTNFDSLTKAQLYKCMAKVYEKMISEEQFKYCLKQASYFISKYLVWIGENKSKFLLKNQENKIKSNSNLVFQEVVALKLQGEIFNQQGEFLQSENSLKQAVILSQQMNNKLDLNIYLINCCIALAQLKASENIFGEAELYYQQALQQLNDKNKQNLIISDEQQQLQINSEEESSQTQRQLHIASQLESFKETSNEPNSKYIIKIYSDLGSIYLTQMKVKEAEICFLKAISHGNKFYEQENHPSLSIDIVNLGLLYMTIGKFEKAKQQFKLAIQIINNAYGPYSTLLYTPMQNLGRILLMQVRVSEALTQFQNLKLIIEQNKIDQESEQNFMNFLQIEEQICGAYQQLDKFQEAFAEYIYIEQIVKKRIVDSELRVQNQQRLKLYLINIYLQMASICFKSTEKPDPQIYYQKAISTSQSAFEDYQYLQVVTDTQVKGYLLFYQQKFKEVETLYKKALQVIDKINYIHEDIFKQISVKSDFYFQIAQALENQGLFQDAQSNYEQAIRVIEESSNSTLSNNKQCLQLQLIYLRYVAKMQNQQGLGDQLSITINKIQNLEQQIQHVESGQQYSDQISQQNYEEHLELNQQ